MPVFTSFVMLAGMRTGSNFLEANLNALPGVACLGEVFNPHFIGKKDQTELFGVDLEQRDQNPALLLRRIRAKTPGLSGFRYFHDHDARILPLLLDDPACAKIVLTRNPAESYVSWKIAQATGQWKLTNVKNLRQAKAQFDPAEFERYLTAAQDFQLQILRALQTSGQTAFYLDYEDIGDVAVLNGLAGWLGVEARLEAVDGTLKKQNPEELGTKVANFDQMETALTRLDRFNLSRTPNFEPRRPPAIPSYVAASGLLFMPVRSGPSAAVRDWLEKLHPGEVIEEFTQKSLRQWKRANCPHRSFTVLRHPLLRAHAAFREMIVSGRLADQRASLIRLQKADLPPPGLPFADADQHRQAFLAFLRFARLSVAGQTGPRVDPHWASQTAVLQGFAGFQPPDVILREDRLADGLAYLAAELGLTAPSAPRADSAAETALSEIWDASLEEAAEEAYARDYLGFGFGRWRD
ncbi:nodulation protein NodH [Pseudogemmobacter blasticus]|uniref:Nodulation protein NodH n=1 Tax=Fuscovulum blasticum DSM 2131 TaxID=1188250 RepID=A0A2T4JF42_FUSBL|nr:nodulation protein NodH [Fuscovulum blasticum]PTE16463.1 nodulation protein NodH [Fuscovulum blasticum DSM 2131]